MTTAAQLIEETRGRHLTGGQRETVNRLDGGINSSVTSLALEFDAAGVGPGTLLGIDLEEILVWTNSGKTCSPLQRAMNGSAAATHSDDAIIRVNPRFSDFRILEAINEELADLSSPAVGLFKVSYVDVTYDAQYSAYNLTSVTDMLGEPLKLLAKSTGSSRYWPELRRWRFDTGHAAADFASGKAISLYEGGYQGNPIRVFYAAPYSPLATLADVVETVTGLSSSAARLPTYGAAERLLASRPSRRSQTEAQADSRRASEVTTGDTLAAPRNLQAMRERGIRSERARLRAQWPHRLRV